jgi:hypothetical protein
VSGAELGERTVKALLQYNQPSRKRARNRTCGLAFSASSRSVCSELSCERVFEDKLGHSLHAGTKDACSRVAGSDLKR